MAGKIPELAELERTAAAGYGLPEGLRPPEQLLFLSLRAIYRDFYAGQLTREQARLEKGHTLEQYKLYAAMLEDTQRLCGIFVDTNRRTEPLRRAYCLARTKGANDAELLALACQIVQAATGDKTIVGRDGK